RAERNVDLAVDRIREHHTGRSCFQRLDCTTTPGKQKAKQYTCASRHESTLSAPPLLLNDRSHEPGDSSLDAAGSREPTHKHFTFNDHQRAIVTNPSSPACSPSTTPGVPASSSIVAVANTWSSRHVGCANS